MANAERDIDTGTDHILCTVREGVAIITFNRPEARNALSDPLRAGLALALAECRDNADIGAVLLTGKGKAFCAGGDVKGMGDKSRRATLSDEEAVAEMVTRQRKMTGVLMSLRKPTIAALPGAAAGAGMALALACDMRIAAQSAFLTTGYVRVGLSGDYGIAWLLMQMIGSARTRELLLTSERITAERAEGLGLVNRIVPDADLQEEAFALARSLARGPRVALGLIKENIEMALNCDYDAAVVGEAERLVRSSRTEDHKEAVRAFVEKRKPEFQGR
jgi:enoyl-CoA hydratase/carnithine racemase